MHCSLLALLLVALLAHAALAEPYAYMFMGDTGNTSEKEVIVLHEGENDRKIDWTSRIGVNLVGTGGKITEENKQANIPSVHISNDLKTITFKRHGKLKGPAILEITWNYVVPGPWPIKKGA